jgi:hypothetical protein
LFILKLCHSALIAGLLGVQSDELPVVRPKVAILSRSSTTPAHVYDVLDIGSDQFEWVCSGSVAGLGMDCYR